MISFQSVFPPYRGGISKFSDHLYKELTKHDDILAFNYEALYPSILFPGKTQYIEDFNKSEVYAKPALHSYNMFQWSSAVQKLLQRDTEVYMYSHWHPFFAKSQISVLNNIKRYRPDIQTVGIVHNVIPHENFPLKRHLSRKLFELTDTPVVLSTQTYKEFVQLTKGRKPEKLFHPVYNQEWPTEDREIIRKRLGYSKEDNIVLFFGLVRPYKGLDVLVEALNLINLEKLNIKPLIVGEFYVDPDSILKKIKKDHLPQYEIINRFVDEEEAAKYLYASDMMVLPYKSASQSGVLSNALNFNLPVMVSNHPGLSEQVIHGKTGFIFESEDYIALAKHICEIIADQKLPEFRNNVEQFRQDFTWEQFATRLLQIIK